MMPYASEPSNLIVHLDKDEQDDEYDANFTMDLVSPDDDADDNASISPTTPTFASAMKTIATPPPPITTAEHVVMLLDHQNEMQRMIDRSMDMCRHIQSQLEDNHAILHTMDETIRVMASAILSSRGRASLRQRQSQRHRQSQYHAPRRVVVSHAESQPMTIPCSH